MDSCIALIAYTPTELGTIDRDLFLSHLYCVKFEVNCVVALLAEHYSIESRRTTTSYSEGWIGINKS